MDAPINDFMGGGEQTETFRRMMAGDRDAFDSLLAQAQKQLVEFARRQLQSYPALRAEYPAEDALQSGLRVLWQKILDADYVPSGGLDGFLRLARTLIASRIRDRARQVRIRAVDLGWPEDVESIRPFDGEVPDGMKILSVATCATEAFWIAIEETNWYLNILPEPFRPVAAARLEGASYAEIARLLGCSEGNIRTMFKEILRIWRQAHRDRNK